VTDAALLRAEIEQLYDRRDLVEDCWRAEIDTVDNLIAAEGGLGPRRGEHRDKATFYFESYLDLTILIGRLTRKLGDLPKTKT
jgi:hypothetical protein